MRAWIGLVALAVAACDSHLDARIGGALLPQAMGVVAAGDGPTVVVLTGVTPALPAGGPVRLAIDHAVPWSEVSALLARAEAAHVQPTFLVGQRNRIHGFVLKDRLALGPAIEVRALAGGKFCVAPPGSHDMYCVAGANRQISATFVRDTMKQAAAKYGLDQTRVVAEPAVAWADLVRTVDGVRTCCRRQMHVTVAR